MSVPREWRFPGKLLPRSDFFNSLLADAVRTTLKSMMHLCQLDHPVAGLISVTSQPYLSQ